MKLTRKKEKIVKSAIEAWVEEDVLSQDQRQMLLKRYEVVGFDWKRLAKYAFWISIICIVIAVGAIIADDYLRELIAKLFNAPALAKCLCAALVAALIYYYGIKRKYKRPEKIFSNEAIFFLGVLATAVSIAFLGEAIDTGSGHFSILLLIAAIVYGILGLWFPSKLVWVFSLISLGSWDGRRDRLCFRMGSILSWYELPVEVRIIRRCLNHSKLRLYEDSDPKRFCETYSDYGAVIPFHFSLDHVDFRQLWRYE